MNFFWLVFIMFKHLNKPKPDNFKIFDEYLFDDSDNGDNFMECLLFTDINNRDKLLYFFATYFFLKVVLCVTY